MSVVGTPRTSKARFDVVIVGFGPTGATLANLLGREEISTLILDREAEAYHLPRAVHFDDEVMRVLQIVGIADAMAERCHLNPGMKFLATDGRLLLDWPRPQEITRQGWHASYRFHQPELECHLRSALDHLPTVEVGTLCEVKEVKDDDPEACVVYEDRRDGNRHSVLARYVVGCDGANSFLRQCIGGVMTDFGFEERWLVVDALLKRPMPELGDHSIQFCDPGRPATYVRGTGNRRRWEITLLDDEESTAVVSPERTWKLLSRWLSAEDAELERTAVYTFKSCVAERWRNGQLLIAGDAAHLTPPFMGQGMCAGIRDVANLAWKLAACVKGRASDSLLDTYQSERALHAQAYIETAVRLGQLINQADTEAALRSALKRPDGTAKMSSIAPRLGPGLTAGDETHRGLLGWQITQQDGRKIDDLAGQRFVLVGDREMAEIAADQLPDLLVVRSDQTSSANDYLGELGTRAVMLRPDRYILGTACTRDELTSLCGVVQHFI